MNYSRVGKNKVKNKDLRLIATLLAGGIAFFSGSTIAKGIEKFNEESKNNARLLSLSSEELLEEIKEETCFDEVLESQNIDISRMDEIRDYIGVSQSLNSIRLDTGDFKFTSMDNLKSPEEIRIMIAAYKSNDKVLTDSDKENLKNSLVEQNGLVNSYITSSYDYMEKVSMLALKSKILDSKGLDETSLDDVKISAAYERGIASLNYKENGKRNNVTVESHDDRVINLLRSVYTMQNEGSPDFSRESNIKDSDEYSYNDQRGRFILKAGDNINLVMGSNDIEFGGKTR